MSLIPNWRAAWRLFSIQAAALLVLWASLPADQQSAILSLIPWISADKVPGVLGVLVIVGRLVKQGDA